MDKRRQLVHWSEVVTAFLDDPDSPVKTEEEREAEKRVFAEKMIELWDERVRQPQAMNLVSLLAHSELMNARCRSRSVWAPSRPSSSGVTTPREIR